MNGSNNVAKNNRRGGDYMGEAWNILNMMISIKILQG